MASICCWPPDRVPAASRRFWSQRREHRVHAVQAIARAARKRAQQQVVLDAQRARTPGGPRAPARCRAARAGGPTAGARSLAVEADAAAAGTAARPRSRAAASSCRRRWRRPAPPARRWPRAGRRCAAPGCGRSGCRGATTSSMRRCRALLRHAEVGFDHARIAARSRRRALGQLRPWSSTRTWSDTPITSFMLCSTRITVVPSAASFLISTSISRASLWFRPAAGSSSSSSLRLGGQRARDLQPLERAVGHRVGAASPRSRPGRPASSRRCATSRHAASARTSAGVRSSAGEQRAGLAQVAPDHHVLERRHVEEDLQVLERAADAGGGEAVRRLAGEVGGRSSWMRPASGT